MNPFLGGRGRRRGGRAVPVADGPGGGSRGRGRGLPLAVGADISPLVEQDVGRFGLQTDVLSISNAQR